MEEAVAAMDAAGSERAAIMGGFDAGPMAALFPATEPERTIALILANTAARLLASEDDPIGAPPEVVEEVIERVEYGGARRGCKRRGAPATTNLAPSTCWAR
jgi:hypothetical protein